MQLAGGGQGGGGGRISVDLAALRANYAVLANAAAPAAVGAVVKADAYGLGAAAVAPALAAAGCRQFFVAVLSEALALQPHLPADAVIYVLNGLASDEAERGAAAGVRPVLNTSRQARDWLEVAQRVRRPLDAALQVDTGMSRLGLSPETAQALAADASFRTAAPIALLMTHLACADVTDHPANALQLARLRAVADALDTPPPLSIANSAGVFLGEDFHAAVVRTGIALYGAAPVLPGAPVMSTVVRLEARVLQVRDIPAGAGVGYGLDHIAEQPARIATLGVGYADGWSRRLGGRGAAMFEGVRLPMVGRVSMDSCAIDISALAPGALDEGDYVELLGEAARLDDVARAADTIPYEILTRLGPRLARTYLDTATAKEVQG